MPLPFRSLAASIFYAKKHGRKNGWFDEDNRVYIIYKIENIMEDMRCGNQKAVKLLAELEKKTDQLRS